MLMFSWTEDSSCATLLMPDGDLQCVNQLHISNPTTAAWASPTALRGQGGSNDKRHLLIGSVRPDAKHARFFKAPVPVDGAGGSPIV